MIDRSNPSAPAWLRLADQVGRRRWFRFDRPAGQLVARRREEVLGVLQAASQAVEGGLEAVGVITYEAAPAFDATLVTHSPGVLAPLTIALYERRLPVDLPEPARAPWVGAWSSTMNEEEHREAVEQVRGSIAAGDTYQVNLTFRRRAAFRGAAFDLFLSLARRQDAIHGGFVDLGEHAVCSASPELFFAQDGDCVVARPMKGTAPRRPSALEDRAEAARLASSPKDRAENLMIVDMLRNDLGRVARPGSVRTERLFDVSRFATLWQMTSTVVADTDAHPIDVLAAAFPCASVTGAPKGSTMQRIRELEDTPREVYTGSLFWLGSGRRAEASVAIRTAWVDHRCGVVEYGVGGGIVWDSNAAEEWRECTTKSLVLVESPDVVLLETLLWRPGRGFWLLDEHLERLADSAAYFDLAVPEDLADQLALFARRLPAHRHRVRLRLAAGAGLELQAEPLSAWSRPRRVALARSAVDSGDRWLYHKTTRRRVYEDALAGRPGFDDVLLWNERRELTESTIANVALDFGSGWVTPPVDCGLLAGTLRRRLLERGWLSEEVVPLERLSEAREIVLMSSVRGLLRADLQGPSSPS